MRKLFIVIIIIFLLMSLFTACVDTSSLIERYTIEAGRLAFVQHADFVMPTKAVQISYPEGYDIVYPYDDLGLSIISKNVADNQSLYGLADFEGNVKVDCVYTNFEKSGDFFMGKKEDAEDGINDEYHLFFSANFLFATPNFITSFVAVGKDYFALYTRENSDVYSKEGIPVFGTNRQLSSRFEYSICDDYLLAQDADYATYLIHEIVNGKATLYKSFISTQHVYYAVNYLYKDNFLVVETTISNNSNYNYSDEVEGVVYYYKQKTMLLGKDKKEKGVKLEFPVIAITNEYSPTLSYDKRNNLNLKKGYSTALVHVLDENKKSSGQAYYVMNKELINVVKMPAVLSPFAFVFKNNVGFAGGALERYEAALFSLDMNKIWKNSESEYYAQSFNDNKYVLAKSVGNQLKYGCMDISGEQIFDFELDFLATYTEGYSVALKKDEYYKVDEHGDFVEKITDIKKGNIQFAFNSYIYISEDKLGLKNYRGDEIIKAAYDSVHFQGYVDKTLYIMFNKDNSIDVFKLT